MRIRRHSLREQLTTVPRYLAWRVGAGVADCITDRLPSNDTVDHEAASLTRKAPQTHTKGTTAQLLPGARENCGKLVTSKSPFLSRARGQFLLWGGGRGRERSGVGVGGLQRSRPETPGPGFCASLEELCRSVAGARPAIRGQGRHRSARKSVPATIPSL